MRLIDADAMKELWQGCEIKGSISEMQGFIDGIVEQYNELQEERIIEEAKKLKMIEEAVLIMHSKHQGTIIRSDLSNATILWSNSIEEDKVYMVTDEDVKDSIRRILK